jgi:ribosomal protein S18 acetylase RimI-like enzyme
MRIRTLERSDVRDGFSCGEPSLDVFLQRYAWQNQTRHHLGVTYVAVDDRMRRVLGYFTLSGGSIAPEQAGRTLPGGYDQVPIIRIARLAVDRRAQRVGLGSELLHAALYIANEHSKKVGCAAVIVDAREDTVGFYERYGFRRIGLVLGGSSARPRPVPMLLSIARIGRSVEWPKGTLRGIETTVDRDETDRV